MIRLTFFLWWAAPIILTSSVALAAGPKPLRIGTLELPPYGFISDTGEKQGVLYELNEEIGKRSGLPYTNVILPYARMVLKLRQGELDLISSQPHSSALAAGSKLAIQFNINVVAATAKDSSIAKLEDFKDKVVLYHLGATYPELDHLPRKIHRVPDYALMPAMLTVRKDVDGAVFSEPAYYYLLRTLGLHFSEFGPTILVSPDREQWIFVRKDMPQDQRNCLRKIVDDLRNEHMFERLLQRLKNPLGTQ